MQKYQFYQVAVSLFFDIDGHQYLTNTLGPNLFINEQAARDWASRFITEANSVTDPLRKPKHSSQAIEPVIITESELDSYEYLPGWDVEVEVIIKKTINVEIEPGTCDNETDAMIEAERVVNDGEMEYEIERADCDSFEADAQYAVEVD